MDVVGISVILLLAAGIGRLLSSEGTERGLDALGAGFLPYRADMGWPRGVQEGEPVAFKLSAMSERGAPSANLEPPPDAGIEVIELDGGQLDAELTGIDHGHISGGTSLRFR
jgi:hypothetical protein